MPYHVFPTVYSTRRRDGSYHSSTWSSATNQEGTLPAAAGGVGVDWWGLAAGGADSACVPQRTGTPSSPARAYYAPPPRLPRMEEAAGILPNIQNLLLEL